MTTLNNITFNLANTPIRRQTLQGKNYIVAPVAMLTEGVHNGSNGPLLYKEGPAKKAVPAWNMKPIVVYHPSINGLGVTACDPDILERQQVGMLMRTKWAGKLRAEAWIDEDRANAVDPRVIDALENNKMMEVSTGLFTENEGGPGVWNGVAYDAEAVNHQPDHLALLPDKIGACSIADGAGLLQLNEAAQTEGLNLTGMLANEMDYMRKLVGNAMSHERIFSAISSALRAKFKSNGTKMEEGMWIVDVYDDFFIYNDKNKLYRLGYTQKDETVELADSPEEVMRVTEYRTIDGGKFVGNEQQQEIEMKKKTVDSLINNEGTQWTEDDRAVLTAMEESVLEKMVPKAPVVKEEKPTDNGKPEAPEAKVEPKVEQPVTMEQYVNNAPQEYREVLLNGLAAHKAQKDALIESITANEANKFSKEFLATKDVQELQGLASLAGAHKVTGNMSRAAVPMFDGASTPLTSNAGATKEEGLALPTMNFEASA